MKLHNELLHALLMWLQRKSIYCIVENILKVCIYNIIYIVCAFVKLSLCKNPLNKTRLLLNKAAKCTLQSFRL